MTEPPGLDAWDAWRPEVVADRLDRCDVPWAIAAGWAVDLFVGRETRAHGDLEIAVPAHRFAEVRGRFGDCDFFIVGDGRVTPLEAGAVPTDERHQTWALERASRRWRLDVFREPADGDTWICRRDPSIRRPYAEVREFTSEGVPYLAPEIVLLFKARNLRPKDDADLARVLPLLDGPRRRWLAAALARVHPGHPWLHRVKDPTVAD
jgi:Aminoglycoside-2''-adenylyltransferase